MTSFGFFADAALTTPIVSAVQFIQAISSPVAVDKKVYFGSRNAARVCRATSGPGVVQVAIALAGAHASDIKLALSSAGLATAIGGASLPLGLEILGGQANALVVHIRALDNLHSAGAFPVDVTTNDLSEFDLA